MSGNTNFFCIIILETYVTAWLQGILTKEMEKRAGFNFSNCVATDFLLLFLKKNYRESQITMAGKDLQDHRVQPLTQHYRAHSTILWSTMCICFLNTSRDGNSTTALGTLCQYLTTFSAKKFSQYPISTCFLSSVPRPLGAEPDPPVREL